MKRKRPLPEREKHSLLWHRDKRVMDLLEAKPQFIAQFPEIVKKRNAEINRYSRQAGNRLDKRTRSLLKIKLGEIAMAEKPVTPQSPLSSARRRPRPPAS